MSRYHVRYKTLAYILLAMFLLLGCLAVGCSEGPYDEEDTSQYQEQEQYQYDEDGTEIVSTQATDPEEDLNDFQQQVVSDPEAGGSADEAPAVEATEADQEVSAAGTSREIPVITDEDGYEVAADSMLVVFDDSGSGATDEDKDNVASEADASVTNELALDDEDELVQVLEVPEASDAEDLAGKKKDLEEQPGVVRVEPDYVGHNDWYPNDPRLAMDGDVDQDNIAAVDLIRAWDIARGAGVMINIIDSGCRTSHLDQGRIVRKWDVLNNDPVPEDTQGHGTAVAGTAAAVANNARNVAGVAPYAFVMCTKVEGSADTVTSSTALAGLQLGHAWGARVHNMSFGGFGYSTTFANYVNQISQTDVIVASIGNCGCFVSTRYPVSYPGITGVSGLLENGSTRWTGSSYGPSVDLSAPAINVWATSYRCDTCDGTFMGTSFAAPMTAGVAAVVLSKNLGYSGVQVRQKMHCAADDLGTLGWDQFYGYGRIDAHGALLCGGSSSPVLRGF